jgi:HTH-type transcriptional regulator / antitoxin HigA
MQDAISEGSSPPPGDLIREELEKRGWTQKDLAMVLGQPLARVNQIVLGNQSISPETAIALEAALDVPAREWIARECAYRRSVFIKRVERLQVEGSDDLETLAIRKRKRLLNIVPIKEIQKRGWVQQTEDLSEIEEDVRALLEVESLDEEPGLNAALRRSNPDTAITPSQMAWCFRARQIARSFLVGRFREDRLEACASELRRLAAYSQEVRKVPKLLADHGIRFVVIEPLSGTKIDGVTTWLADDAPVIGMSLRYDRLDSFWFTLCHEFSHVRAHDDISVDADIGVPGRRTPTNEPEIERRANSEAAAMLVPPGELEGFIRRVGPIYSRERINQFANRLKIHPAIIVGQLQRRGELSWSAHRETLVKIRDAVTPVALTDGWGSSISPGALR